MIQSRLISRLLAAVLLAVIMFAIYGLTTRFIGHPIDELDSLEFRLQQLDRLERIADEGMPDAADLAGGLEGNLLPGGEVSIARAGFQQIIRRKAAEAGVRIGSMQAGSERERSGLTELNVRISLTATWDQATAFLNAVEGTHPVMRARQLTIQRQQGGDRGVLEVSLQLNLHAFFRPDEAGGGV